MKNRSNIELVAVLLEAFLSPSNKTRAMYDAKVSYLQLSNYLDMLQEKKLVTNTENGLWVVTDEGREYVYAYRAIKKIIGSANAPMIRIEQ